jgi:hypothetical protein
LIERSEALWLVLLGSHHPVTQQYHDYKQYLSTHEHRLERIVPTDLKMRYMTPALLARRIQLATNSWLTTQARTALPCTFIGLTDIFLEMGLGKQWEPPFPSQYISNPAQAALSSFASPVTPSMVSTSGTAITTGAASTLTANSGVTGSTSVPNQTAAGTLTSGTTTGSAPRDNTIVRNLLYNDTVFGQYKAMNIKAKTLKDQLRTRRVAYPTNSSRGGNMSLTHHVHGVCNSGCRNAADHYAHSAIEDETFRAWCAEHKADCTRDRTGVHRTDGSSVPLNPCILAMIAG